MKIAILIISGVLVLFIAYLAIMASRLRKANFESDSDKIKILIFKLNPVLLWLTFGLLGVCLVK